VQSDADLMALVLLHDTDRIILRRRLALPAIGLRRLTGAGHGAARFVDGAGARRKHPSSLLNAT
jgi:hypothetical protein